MDQAAFDKAVAEAQAAAQGAGLEEGLTKAALLSATTHSEALGKYLDDWAASNDAMIAAAAASPSPPEPEPWPPAATPATPTTGISVAKGQRLDNITYKFTKAAAAGNCVLTAAVASWEGNNLTLDAMLHAQGMFWSLQATLRWLRVLNVGGGVGEFNFHQVYGRQGLIEHLYCDAAPTYSFNGQSSYDLHAYGNSVDGNIDLQGYDWTFESQRPSVIGGTVNCPIERFEVEGFIKKNGGMVNLGGLSGGQHKNVHVDDARVVNMTARGTYAPGCYVKGQYTGVLSDFSGGTLDLSGMRKVAA